MKYHISHSIILMSQLEMSSTALTLCFEPFKQTLEESSIITHRNRSTERALENVPSITSMHWAGQLVVATFHYETPSSLYNSAL